MNAVVPVPATILGQELEPFSIGHAFYLHSLGVADLETIPETLCAIYVCCHRFEDIKGALKDPWLKAKMWWWGRRLTGKRVAEAKAAFFAYSAISQPNMNWRGDGVSNVPYLSQLKSLAQSECGYTRSEALNAPINEVVYDVAAWADVNGHGEVLEESSEEMADRADAIHEDLVRMTRGEFGEN